jgi:two-component system alkaline phosphatase synthesis response regulator PhoP
MKLLLVDDDAFLRDMYATKFSELGHTVDVADGAAMALAKLEQDQSFEVILLDMIMPGLSGVDLLKEITKRLPDLKAKRIVLSNQGQNEDIEEATTAGAIGYIIKAESIPTEVVKKVEKIMSSVT